MRTERLDFKLGTWSNSEESTLVFGVVVLYFVNSGGHFASLQFTRGTPAAAVVVAVPNQMPCFRSVKPSLPNAWAHNRE